MPGVRLRLPSETLAELAASSATGSASSSSTDRLQHQLRATLETYYPAMTHLFSSIDRSITLAFLRRFPTPEAAAPAHGAPAGAVPAARGLHGADGAGGPARHGSGSIPATPSAGTDRARVRSALALADLLEHVTTILAGYDERRSPMPSPGIPTPAVFAGLPGAGSGHRRDPDRRDRRGPLRFPTPGSLLAEAGLAPVTRQSGSSRRVVFRYAANHHLRAIWNQWMLTAIRISPWTREAYDAAGRARPEPQPRRPVGRRPLGTDPLAVLAGPRRLRSDPRSTGRHGRA